MHERDVAHALVVEELDVRQVRTDRIPILDADIDGALAFFFEGVCIFRLQSEADNVRVGFRGIDDRIDHLQAQCLRAAVAGVVSDVLGHERSEEDRVEAALLHSGIVHFRAGLVRIVSFRHVETGFDHPQRRVGVRIEGEHAIVNRERARDERFLGFRGRRRGFGRCRLRGGRGCLLLGGTACEQQHEEGGGGPCG